MRTINLPLFGTLIPGQGGRLGAILPGKAEDGSEDYALIVVEAEGAEIEPAPWSEDYTEIEGADSVHDGAANTAAMAAAGLPLAVRIQALEVDGHKDCYLPSAAEMRALSATVPHLFNKDDWYWTSTQYSRRYAWCQDFEYGDSHAGSKGTLRRARAVRKVHLHAFNA